jgi:hypothetical protein
MTKEVLKEIDPTKDWVVDDTNLRTDYELTIIKELAKPRVVVLAIPVLFQTIAGRALRLLFPQMTPYTKAHPYSLRWNSNPYNLHNGYWRCSPDIVLEITETAFYTYLRFYVNEERVSPPNLYESFLKALREASRGVICNLSAGEVFSSDWEDEDEEEAAETPTFLLDEAFTSPFEKIDITMDEFLSFYPTEVVLSFRRVIQMVDTIANEPASGLHFSALIAGPPGTGKSLFSTLLAKYAAEEKKALVIFASGVSGFEVIHDAIKLFPLVLFIFDECEFLAQNREQRPTKELIHIMQLLDGYAYKSYASWGIIFTTNRPHTVDPAFLRPIRMDELIELSPIQNGHFGLEIFRYYCKKLGLEAVPELEERIFEGRTHAECAALAHKVYRMKKFGKEVSVEEIKSLLKDISKWSRPQKIKGSIEEKTGF